MAKMEETGETVLPGKGGKPLSPPRRQRKFPFRLWLWAILMTAATGALGYYAWQLRGEAGHNAGVAETNQKERDAAQGKLADTKKSLDGCETDLAKATGELTTTKADLDKAQTSCGATQDKLAALQKQAEDLASQKAAADRSRKDFAKMVDTGDLKVDVRQGQLVLELPATVLFASGSAEPSAKAKVTVPQIAFVLKKMPDRTFMVVGHTDNAKLVNSTFKDNWELSTERALAVTRILVEAGMNPKHLIAAGEGEHHPVADNHSATGRQRNRRIEIVLLPNIAELPALPGDNDDKGKHHR